MESRFKTHLKNLNNFILKSEVYYKKKLDGKHKKLFFSELKGVTFEAKNSTGNFEPLAKADIAMTVPKTHYSDDFSKADNQLICMREKRHARCSLSLLRDSKIYSPFIHNFFYCGREGEQISAQANCDLVTFINKKHKISAELAKSLVAQLVLAVFTLHNRGLVHRDIKPDNILVFIDRQGRVQLKLADLDTVRGQDEEKIPFNGTPDYLAPEIFSKMDQRPDILGYQQTNKKAVDCFALGKVLEYISIDREEKCDKEESQLSHLCSGLLNNDPVARYTINQTMNDVYFGATDLERRGYFQSITDRFSDNAIYIDHYFPQSFPEEGEAFYLLPEKIKSIYHLTEKLDNQDQFFLDNKSLDKYVITALNNTAKQLIQAIDEGLKDNQLKDFHQYLLSMRADVMAVLALDDKDELMRKAMCSHRLV